MVALMLMAWDGIGVAEYEAARRQVNWEGDVPRGLLFHAAAITVQGLRVAELWAAAEDYHAFVRDRLRPGTQTLGLPGAPRVELAPAHAVFAPIAEHSPPPPFMEGVQGPDAVTEAGC